MSVYTNIYMEDFGVKMSELVNGEPTTNCKLVNGELVALTAEEIAEVEAALSAAPSETEIKWRLIRTQRDEKLRETDWRASSDLTLSDDWKDYRQALRNITLQSSPFNITWPTAPSS